MLYVTSNNFYLMATEFEDNHSQASKQMIELERHFEESYNTWRLQYQLSLDNINKAIQAGKKSLPVAVKQLAEYGWFIQMDFGINELQQLSQDLNSERGDRVNTQMVKFFEKNQKKILKRLVDRFPERKEVLNSAFKAHKRKEYFLSVPVFLSQSDGICKKITHKSLFGGDKAKAKEFKPHTYNWANQYEAESIYSIMLEPLKHKGGFNKHYSEFNPIGISRHDILHGASTDYGTQLISCKAMSMVSFVGESVYDASRHMEKAKRDTE
jgi:hypothetical protein